MTAAAVAAAAAMSWKLVEVGENVREVPSSSLIIRMSNPERSKQVSLKQWNKMGV